MSSTSASSTSTSSSTKSTRSNRPPESQPLTYGEAFKQWVWQPSQSEAEDRILSLVEGIPSDRKVEHKHTEISLKATITGGKETEKDRTYFINEYAITTPSKTNELNTDANKKTLVMMHGYGAGLGFFIKNFGPLAAGLGPNWNIHALDWLGYGGSSRPKFKIPTDDLSVTREVAFPSPLDFTGTTTNTLNENLAVKETEDWFVESLEAWRKAKKLESFVLMGHSMGGYLAAVYAFRYPNRVEKLVLVSPAGVEHGYDPSVHNERSFRKAFLSGSSSEKQTPEEASVTADQIEAAIEGGAGLESETRETEFGTTPRGQALIQSRRDRFGPKMTYLWNSHISPFLLIRSSMFLGPRLISYWSSNRFHSFPQAQREAMHTYAYKTFAAKGSGEYAITRLLAPGVFPRMPLLERVGPQFGLLKCPSLWLYGDRDWMDSDSGRVCVRTINELDVSVKHHAKKQGIQSPFDRRAEFMEVPTAGHHLYLDNPDVFNRAVIKYLK